MGKLYKILFGFFVVGLYIAATIALIKMAINGGVI